MIGAKKAFFVRHSRLALSLVLLVFAVACGGGGTDGGGGAPGY